ncbi:MAG: hypothetical protein ACNI3A_02950 [Desulfovibrio sp.]|uniref:hypothetical protein n=1 Tax=Desulfovibrio sp. 7SRBS1 TaxID=3378064 RepID=UPI003B40CB58
MSFFSTITDFFGGDVVETIADTVKSYFPPSMSEAEKAELSARITEAEHKRERELMAMTMKADHEVTERAAQLEGTAKDLAALPVVGRLILFLRGCQRPVWGFATMAMDWLWFTEWKLDEQQQTALIVINVLVLGFLFGERTVKNLQPLLVQIFGGRMKGAK